MAGGGAHGRAVGIGRLTITRVGLIMATFRTSISTLIQAGGDTIMRIAGTDIHGTINPFPTSDFNRTGGGGKQVIIGQSTKLGACRAISLDRRNRGRRCEMKDESNIDRDLRFSGMSNRDSSNTLSNMGNIMEKNTDKTDVTVDKVAIVNGHP